MTRIAVGSLLDALETFRELSGVEFVHFPAYTAKELKERPELAPAHTFYARWRLPPRPQLQLVFVNPPGPIEALRPRRDRHLVFEDQVPSAWKPWIKAHKLKPETIRWTPAQLRGLLCQGAPASGIPRFTEAAATHMLAVYPGGLVPLLAPARALLAAESPEPITVEAATALWPVKAEAAAYTADARALIGAAGTQRSLDESLKAVDGSWYQLSRYAEKACSEGSRALKWAHEIGERCRVKTLTPEAAPVLLALVLFLEAQAAKSSPKESDPWPSNSEEPSSASRYRRAAFELSNIPW